MLLILYFNLYYYFISLFTITIYFNFYTRRIRILVSSSSRVRGVRVVFFFYVNVVAAASSNNIYYSNSGDPSYDIEGEADNI